MIIVESVEKVVMEDKTVAVMCNKCGEFIQLDHLDSVFNFDLNTGFNCGNDKKNYKFEICEHCLMEYMSCFKIEPEITNDIVEWEWPTDDWKQEEENIETPRPNTLEPFRYV